MVSSPPDSEISLWSLSSCWIWSSMLLSKFYKISFEMQPSPSPLTSSPQPPAVWCWTWWGPGPPPSPPRSTPPCQGRQLRSQETNSSEIGQFSDLNKIHSQQTTVLNMQYAGRKKVKNNWHHIFMLTLLVAVCQNQGFDSDLTVVCLFSFCSGRVSFHKGLLNPRRSQSPLTI